MSNAIATTILDQLGGNRFRVMVGFRNGMAHEDGIGFRVGRNSKRVNYVRIRLTANDDYTLEFGCVRGLNYTIRVTRDVVYADSLRAVFEAETGLCTSL